MTRAHDFAFYAAARPALIAQAQVAIATTPYGGEYRLVDADGVDLRDRFGRLVIVLASDTDLRRAGLLVSHQIRKMG